MPYGVVAYFSPMRPKKPRVVMYWINTYGREASACVWEIPGTNHEDFE